MAEKCEPRTVSPLSMPDRVDSRDVHHLISKEAYFTARDGAIGFYDRLLTQGIEVRHGDALHPDLGKVMICVLFLTSGLPLIGCHIWDEGRSGPYNEGECGNLAFDDAVRQLCSMVENARMVGLPSAPDK